LDGEAVTVPRGAIHHLEIWVPELAAAQISWGWLLERLGYSLGDDWPDGQIWRLGASYLVLEAGPHLRGTTHDRLRPGLNHVAFHGGSRDEVDAMVVDSADHGWALLFADRHPFAGGPDTYAAYLENDAGFEVELVAAKTT
jgi:catechol 2,3-dioxygenase-like lactoylglutathione lyase family enzyme